MEVVVVFDLDDTLICSAPEFVRFNNAFFGTEISIAEYREHWSSTRWKSKYTDEEWEVRQGVEWAAHALETGFYRNLPAMDGAREALIELCSFGVRPAILTSRREDFRNDSEYCMEKKFPEIKFFDIFFSGAYEGHNVPDIRHTITKGAILAEMGAKVLIDDQPKHAFSSVDNNIPAVLFGNSPEASGVISDLGRGLYRGMDWPETVSIIKHILSR